VNRREERSSITKKMFRHIMEFGAAGDHPNPRSDTKGAEQR
jgi:hypothetical protein